MNTIIFLSLVFIAIIVVIPFILVKAFKNPVRPHEQTPCSEGQSPCQELWIPTKNKKKLYGWWLKGEKGKPVLILVHGWGRNASKMMPYIKHLHPLGYHLLIFDSRNHGKSDQDGYSSMVKFAEDIQAVIDFAEQQFTLEHGLGLIGLSIGGAASVYAASKDSRVNAVVTVGAFANPEDVMKTRFLSKHIPYFPFIWLLFKFIEFRIKASFKKIAPENNIHRASADFLIIHGSKDDVVPPQHAVRLAKAARPKQAKLWMIEGKGHSNCHFEKGFWDTLHHFFSTHIPK